MQEEYFKCFNVEEEIRVLFLFLFFSVFGFFCTRIKTWLDRTHPILTQSKERQDGVETECGIWIQEELRLNPHVSTYDPGHILSFF